MALAGRDVPLSLAAGAAYFWQDAAVGAAFWALELLFRRRRIVWLPYALLVVYVAINVVVVRALSSPLTVPMLRAAGVALLDSIRHYLTIENAAAISTVLAAAWLFPTLLRRLAPRVLWLAAAAMAVLLVAGPMASRAVPTAGLHRNAISALVATMRPRLAARAADGDWRASPFFRRTAEDASAWRGSARDFDVVLVVLESTGTSELALYGAPADAAPNLTILARAAMIFERAYAVYPESIKGLFALMCSRYPAFDVVVEAHARVPCDSLAKRLAASGYKTALFHSGRFAYLGMKDVLDAQGFDVLEDAGAIGGIVESSFGVDEPSAVRRMLSWVDALPASQRLFLTYLPVAGHHPYVSPVPGPFTGPGERNAFRNAVHYGDQSLGALLEGLRSRRRAPTLVVVMGDHGEAFGQHEGNYGHTQFIYEENVRIPLVFAPMGVTAWPVGGMRIRRAASVIDVAPTILDLAALTIPASYQGASLLVPQDRMALFYTDYALGWLGLRDDCWKYVYEVEGRRSQLFDLCRDPNEGVDVAPAHAERVAIYRERVEQWAAAQRAKIESQGR